MLVDGPQVSALQPRVRLAEREQVGRSEYIARYIKATGRDLPVSEVERFVFAEKL